MHLILYTKIIKFSFGTQLTYPLDIVADIIRYVLKIVLLLVFWSIVAISTSTKININELLAYFLMSTAISDISMADTGSLGRRIRRAVSQGSINQQLIRPVGIISYFYASTLGLILLKIILASISIFISLMINPPKSFLGIILFIIFFIYALSIAFSYNIFEGALALNFTEVNGMKNAMRHITRILSGQLVPLSFFPEAIKNILLLTPIPLMVFMPINVLSYTTLNNQIIFELIAGLIWSILLYYLVKLYWQHSLKKYDAAGN